MNEPSYFQSALSSFVTDAACGGAIRHLVDIGYTLDQIVDRLDYPAPRAKVQRIMMDYLFESRVLLREEPSEELFAAKEAFVQEQDAFGRRSMRKIIIDQRSHMPMTTVSETPLGSSNMESASLGANLGKSPQQGKTARIQSVTWKEYFYETKRDGKLTELLHHKCDKNGEAYSYISCSFWEVLNDQNSQMKKNENNRQSGQGEPGKSGGVPAAEKIWSCLNNRQRDYIQGIRWDQPVLYHRLNQRMLEIIGKLYEAGVYSGAAFFAASCEKIVISSKELPV